MIERTLQWVFSISDWTVFYVIFAMVVLALFIQWAGRTWLWNRDQRMIEHGYGLGYRQGQRDSEAQMIIAGTFEQTTLGDAHYPMIVETLGDGTKRRLDR